jgi:hypothetical protein
MANKIYVCMEQRLIVNSVLNIVTGCWEWIGARDMRRETPYGKISTWEYGRRRKRQAHIVSYETFIGPVPPGHEVDHLCRYGFCICPDHLEPVLPAVNKERRVYTYTARTTTYNPEAAHVTL